MNGHEPLYPHLLDIVRHPASRHLILAGGFGIRLKRTYIAERVRSKEVRVLIEDVPEARVTLDLDFFLRMEAFVRQEGAQAVRQMLDELQFPVKEQSRHWQFGRPLRPGDAHNEVIVDVLARLPDEEESKYVRADRVRVRSKRDPRGAGSHAELHGRTTPEAFAVEDSPTRLPVPLPDGGEAYVWVPHPYPWICMKTVAAHDWLQNRGTARQREGSAKHLFDVYLLVAMLTPVEFRECLDLSRRYSDHPQCTRIRTAAAELFDNSRAPGFVQAEQTVGRPLDHETFWKAYRDVVGLEHQTPD